MYLLYIVITIKEAQAIKPVTENHKKYWRFRISECSSLQSIWLIVKNNGKVKDRVVITQDSQLINAKTGKILSEDETVDVQYMLKFNARDSNGNWIKVTMWDCFNDIIKQSAKCELKRFKNSNMTLSDLFGRYLRILNDAKWIATAETTINLFKENDDINYKIINFNIVQMKRVNDKHN